MSSYVTYVNLCNYTKLLVDKVFLIQCRCREAPLIAVFLFWKYFITGFCYI